MTSLSRGGVLLAALLAVACAPLTGSPATPDSRDAIGERTARMETHDGFIPLHYDAGTGKVFLTVEPTGEDFLYLNTLATGLGTTGPLLDRGQVGTEAVVRFERRGARMLLVRQNTGFRAEGGHEALQRSVDESFPTSVIASFPIETSAGERHLVDATDFFLSDAFDVGGAIRRAGQGTVRLDRDRSFIDADRSGAFPRNTEVQAALTHVSDDPGWGLRRHAPDGRAITLRQQHSFVALPEPGFEPRAFDPRMGIFSVSFLDFAQPLSAELRQRHIARWRLEKADPAAALSEPVEPIVYYLDPGVPEPYRAAFIEGGMWWNEIFEAAGFRDAFRVEDLPDDVDPMDARYSVIHWVHRSDPGPSVGPSFRDPRTGEIIRTVVRMDSHRSLVNYAIYAGMRPALAPGSPSAEEVAMARRRQHSAHEIGHTLGLAHNFIAASQGRSSVMDYPHTLVDVDASGRLDISRAYREGGGAWDTLAIRYAYTPFDSPAEERAGLEAIVRDGLERGLRFVTGGDARISGSIPEATQWIEGADMLDALDRATRVRSVLLEHFDERAVDPGQPLALLADRLRFVYLHHRYALHGAIKTVGGMDYSYAIRGDGQVATQIAPPERQRAALDRALAALAPEALAVPERVTAAIPPPPFGYGGDTWGFDSPAGSALDPLALARTLASEIVDGLLHPERAARLVSFHARAGRHPSLDEVVSRLVDSTWGARRAGDAMEAALGRVAERAVVDGLIDLAANEDATVEARAVAERHLRGLHAAASGRGGQGEAAAHARLAASDIERFLERREAPTGRTRPRPMPLPWP
jgi:hypothetical protein